MQFTRRDLLLMATAGALSPLDAFVGDISKDTLNKAIERCAKWVA